MSPSTSVSPPDSPPTSPASRASTFTQIALGIVVAGLLELRFPGIIRTLLVFAVMLSILVFVHEWGHFQFARWAGMKVNRFALGFPPFIFNKKKNGIIYSIGALPVGGMVDIAGLGSEEEMVSTAHGKISEPKRDASRPFGQKQFQDANLGWRFLVIFAGPLMNFIFAIVVAISLFCFVGFPDASSATNNSVGLTLGGSPAARAGVQAGDLIVGVNGIATRDDQKITQIIRSSNGKPVTLQLQRDDQPIQIKLQPKLTEMNSEDGSKTEKVPTVGILFDVDPKTVTYRRIGVKEATQKAFQVSLGMTEQVLGLVKRAVTLKLTEIDKSSIGGPVKIAQRAGRASRQGGFRESVMMSIALSMNLGLMNLLPLPALDGGRIMFLGYELVARRPFNPKWEGIAHAAGMLMLLTFMLFITLRDVNAGALLERFIH